MLTQESSSEVAASTPRSSGTSHAHLEDFLDLLRQLVREPSVVGTEDSFFRVLRRELEETDAVVTRYQGILVAHGKDPESLILSAHVDRHGLICTGPNEFQYAAFITANRGELDGDSVSEQMMHSIQDRFIQQRVQAHMPYTGTYQGQGVIQNTFICPYRNNVIFELTGLEFLQPGSPVSYLDRLAIQDGRISAQLDNVLTVAMLVYLFRNGFPGTVLFTAQEEAGRSWRYALAWFLRQQWTTQRLLVMDTSPFPDTAAAEAQEVVLRRKDANGAFSEEMTAELQAKCESLGIAYTFKDEYVEKLNEARQTDGLKALSLGRTELGRIVAATDGQINGSTVQVPTTGYHTPQETANLASVEAVMKLVWSCVR